ncbi:MAG: DUF21 domain-containing protein, partial [Candidatus Wallbacteria bacterium]|nr:DUF21 domain-containing protein [Candidatus Wallbacteria bacterium]
MLAALAAVLILVTLLVLAGLFAGCETAVISVNRMRLKNMEEAGLHKAKVIIELLHHPHRLINALLLGTNLAIVGATAITTLLIKRYADIRGAELEFLTTLALTPFVLLFCEIIPKTIFRFKANTLSLKFSGFIQFFYNFFLTATLLIEGMARFFLRDTLESKSMSQKQVVSKEQLKLLLKMGVQDGALDRRSEE